MAESSRDAYAVGQRVNRYIVYALLIIGSILFFIPFLWLLSTSLKPIEQAMTDSADFLPRVSYVTYEGRAMKVYKDKEVAVEGSMVLIAEGPLRGSLMLLAGSDLTESGARVRIQESDRVIDTFARYTPIKPVRPGWVKVVEKLDASRADREPFWTCVPPEEIETRVEWQWSNYVEAVEKIPFTRYLGNTLIVSILSTIAMTLSSALAAYGFSRIQWPGRDFFFALSIATMMVPGPVTMIPTYGIFRALGMVGTLQPLWFPSLFAHAFNIFLLRQFFLTLPQDLSDAAKIDGCGDFRIFIEVILPLSKPALAVVALFQFMYTWNDFMGPLLYLNRPETFTLALGLQQFQSKSGGTEWHLLMAISTLIILPVLILFLLAQKTFIQGMARTGMKE